jgi:hypothetical protein
VWLQGKNRLEVLTPEERKRLIQGGKKEFFF